MTRRQIWQCRNCAYRWDNPELNPMFPIESVFCPSCGVGHPIIVSKPIHLEETAKKQEQIDKLKEALKQKQDSMPSIPAGYRLLKAVILIDGKVKYTYERINDPSVRTEHTWGYPDEDDDGEEKTWKDGSTAALVETLIRGHKKAIAALERIQDNMDRPNI